MDISNSADIRYLASVFPELTPEMVEEKLYEAISRELDDPEENPELVL